MLDNFRRDESEIYGNWDVVLQKNTEITMDGAFEKQAFN